MTFVEIIRDTFISGTPVFVGETLEVDEITARSLVKTNKGKLTAAPVSELPPEPPKPKFKKVAKSEKADEAK